MAYQKFMAADPREVADRRAQAQIALAKRLRAAGAREARRSCAPSS